MVRKSGSVKWILTCLFCPAGFSSALLAAQSPVSVDISVVPHSNVNGNSKVVSFKITNLSTSAISAVAVKSLCINTADPTKVNKITKLDDTLVRYFDDDILIPPGGTKGYEIGGAPDLAEWKCDGEFQGALFEDGTSIGEPEALARIRQIRVFIAREVEWHIAALAGAQSRDDRRDVILEAIDKHNTSAMDAAQSRDERLAVYDVSHVVDDNLREMHLASGLPLGDGQRVEIILGHLREWQQRLARHMTGGQVRN